MKWIRKWKVKKAARKRQALRDRLARDLWFVINEKNDGLRKSRLANMPGVDHIVVQTGLIDFVTVVMDDGFEILSSGIFLDEPLKKAALMVVARHQEKGSA